MTYATQADLIAWCGLQGQEELTQLTDPTNSAINGASVAAKLTMADNEINARIGSLTAPYPAVIVNVACRIARFYLYASGRPDYVLDDFNWAMKFLDDVRTGKVSLGSYQEAVPLSLPYVYAPTTVFNATLLGGL
jgi:phage gp36-like protein